jgi:hypothetical protein
VDAALRGDEYSLKDVKTQFREFFLSDEEDSDSEEVPKEQALKNIQKYIEDDLITSSDRGRAILDRLQNSNQTSREEGLARAAEDLRIAEIIRQADHYQAAEEGIAAADAE